jgi:hypothetical protein
MANSMIRIMLCSDEFGGEHAPITVQTADLEELTSLGYRRVHEAGHYDDGAETWQGPARTMARCWKKWGRKTR